MDNCIYLEWYRLGVTGQGREGWECSVVCRDNCVSLWGGSGENWICPSHHTPNSGWTIRLVEGKTFKVFGKSKRVFSRLKTDFLRINTNHRYRDR